MDKMLDVNGTVQVRDGHLVDIKRLLVWGDWAVIVDATSVKGRHLDSFFLELDRQSALKLADAIQAKAKDEGWAA